MSATKETGDGFASLFVPAQLPTTAAFDALVMRLEHAKARARVAEVSAEAFGSRKKIEGTRWFWVLPEQVLWQLTPLHEGAPGEFVRVPSTKSWWRRVLDRLREFSGVRQRKKERRARHRMRR